MGLSFSKVSGALMLVAVAITLLASLPANAQVTSNILLRVFKIGTAGTNGAETGTAFTIERNGTQYLVTAAHMVAGLPECGATIHLAQGGKWRSLTVEILRCGNPHVDVVALKIAGRLSPEYPIETTLKGVTLGQEVYFFGYPYGLSTFVTSNGYPLALVKHGIVSAIGGDEKTGVVLYIDGFNNPGFSGGPIVVYDHFSDKVKVIGVVSGYLNQRSQAQVSNRPTPLTVLTNSGILVGYSIEYALDAINTFQQRDRR